MLRAMLQHGVTFGHHVSYRGPQLCAGEATARHLPDAVTDGATYLLRPPTSNEPAAVLAVSVWQGSGGGVDGGLGAPA